MAKTRTNRHIIYIDKDGIPINGILKKRKEGVALMFPVYRLTPTDSRYSGIVLVAANTPLEADKYAEEFLQKRKQIQGEYCAHGLSNAQLWKENELMSKKKGIIVETLYFKDGYQKH